MNEDQTRIEVVFFLMSEDNVRKQIRLPWVSFGSDASSMAPVEPFTLSSAHPRAYGNFARLLGRYVREEKLIPLAEAVRRLTGLPAANLGLKDRGTLRGRAVRGRGRVRPGHHRRPRDLREAAPVRGGHEARVRERRAVLKDGEHTGALPGRALKGRGAPAGR